MGVGWSVGFALLTAVLFMSLVFIIARWRNRYDIVDVAWGVVFIAIVSVAILAQDSVQWWTVQSLAAFLVAVWGLRLASHIYARFSSSNSEDKRYDTLRKNYSKKPGGVSLNMYARVFLLQGLLAVVITLPVVLLTAQPEITPNWWAFAGVVVWMVGFFFEYSADRELAAHIRAGKKTLLRSGVWKMSRHPNYFGEATMWWGIWIMTIGTPYVLIGLISPIVITILVRFISGVPLTEKSMSKRDGWDKYKKTTSIFFPLPPKS